MGVKKNREALQSTVVGDGLQAQAARWNFGGNVPDSFEQHARRSIPYYDDGHELVARISDHFLHPGSICYDLGCSSGKLLERLVDRHGDRCRFVGVDCEPAMVEKASSHFCNHENVDIVEADICTMELEKADLIVLNYTVQFVHPKQRQNLLDSLYQSLNWGGALMMFEKVRGADARFQDIMSQVYVELKLENGFTPAEIMAKARSLKGVLEPFSSQANIDMMRRAGFLDVMTAFKYVCFEGFLAIK